MVINVLLNQVKSSLSKSNLGVPAINKSQILMVNDDIIEKKLPSNNLWYFRNTRTFPHPKRY